MSRRKKSWWKRYWWLIIGLGLIVIIVTIALLVFAFNSFGLKGVTFSKESGFYNETIDVEIVPDGVLLINKPVIKYNMNGDDLYNNSDWYNQPLKLEVPENGYRLYTITTFACKDNDDCTKPQVATYVLGKDLNKDVDLDIISINSSQKNLYDYNSGIMVGGRTYDENYRINSDGYVNGNYNNRGKKWMRESYIVRFDIDGRQLWSQNGYIGISGGTSSSNFVKSLKVSLESKDGGEMETVRLRSGQDQFAGNIRSSVASRLVEESGFDVGTNTERVVVFLNGDYYGIFDMQKNYSEYNLAKKYNLEKKGKIKKNKSSEKEVFKQFRIGDNDWDDLEELKNRERLEEVIDMDNYLQYYAIQILLNNTDWPMNNFEAWRFDEKSKTNNKYEDGRIRFLIYDTDLIYSDEEEIKWFDGSDGDIFEYLMENKYNGAGSSFSKVMKSEYYRIKFANLLKGLLDGPFATENVLRVIDEESNKIEHQVKLFSSEDEYQEWKRHIEILRKAASRREKEVRDDIQKYLE